jgi:hypothetical protein
MYRVTLIPKQSTMNDIRRPWIDSGREWNGDTGEFVFDNVKDFNSSNGLIQIGKERKLYIYNAVDFYRVKVEVIDNE